MASVAEAGSGTPLSISGVMYSSINALQVKDARTVAENNFLAIGEVGTPMGVGFP